MKSQIITYKLGINGLFKKPICQGMPDEDERRLNSLCATMNNNEKDESLKYEVKPCKLFKCNKCNSEKYIGECDYLEIQCECGGLFK